MNINDIRESKYLTKNDVEPPIKVKITGISKEDLSKENEPPELKHVLQFEGSKPLVLNVTNAQLIALALGSEETNDWIGKEIVLWNDATVSYAGKLTGGVRARAVKGTVTDDFEDSSIPF